MNKIKYFVNGSRFKGSRIKVMKIIGFMDIEGIGGSGGIGGEEKCVEMVLSADSAMLTGRKPYFLPEGSEDVVYYPCLVVRISRLGKTVARKFASRYYDAVAEGADFVCRDWLKKARAEGHSWTEAVASDGSLAIGPWQATDGNQENRNLENQEIRNLENKAIIPIDEAIERASRVMTIRQGDLIYIHRRGEAISAVRGEQTETGNRIC